MLKLRNCLAVFAHLITYLIHEKMLQNSKPLIPTPASLVSADWPDMRLRLYSCVKFWEAHSRESDFDNLKDKQADFPFTQYSMNIMKFVRNVCVCEMLSPKDEIHKRALDFSQYL